MAGIYDVLGSCRDYFNSNEVHLMETSKLKTTDEIVSYVVDANTGEITDTFMYGDSYKKSTKENREKAREFLAQKIIM